MKSNRRMLWCDSEKSKTATHIRLYIIVIEFVVVFAPCPAFRSLVHAMCDVVNVCKKRQSK